MSYNLKDDYNIGQRLTKAYQNMGVLKIFWDDQHTDLYSKYTILIAIPLNLLPWGCKSWALKESSLNMLDYFLHYVIRRILHIKISQVQEERITNKTIRENFYNIQPIRSIVAARQIIFIRKVACTGTCIPKQLLTAWVNNPCPRGRPLTTNKVSITKSLQILCPPTEYETDIIGNKFTIGPI